MAAYTLTRVSALDGDAILTLAECKSHLRVTHSNEDTLITSLRNSAIGHVERVSGVALASGTWRWTMPRIPARIDLPMGPVTAIGDITYTDSNEAAATYSTGRLVYGSVHPALGDSWPVANYGDVAIEFTAGLASATDAPELLAAVKLLLTHLYENRSATENGNVIPREVPFGVDALIDDYRKVSL